MVQRINVPSIQMLEGQLADTRHTVDIVRTVYGERLRQNPEDDLTIRQFDYLIQLTKELDDHAKNIADCFKTESKENSSPRKTYKGTRNARGTTVTVTIEEDRKAPTTRDLLPRRNLVDHSPSGFDWGYPGSGPAQLALALLADLTGDGEYALRHYQQFKSTVTAGIMPYQWVIEGEDLMGWVKDHT